MTSRLRKLKAYNTTVGVLIALMSLNWVYQNALSYHFWNFTTGWRCGTGAPTNGELILQMFFGLVGIYLGAQVVKNCVRPMIGVLFQFALVCSGTIIWILNGMRMVFDGDRLSYIPNQSLAFHE